MLMKLFLLWVRDIVHETKQSLHVLVKATFHLLKQLFIFYFFIYKACHYKQTSKEKEKQQNSQRRITGAN